MINAPDDRQDSSQIMANNDYVGHSYSYCKHFTRGALMNEIK